ncbi:MAG: ABC transporter permease [Actinobacteria bacterium]|nr:ABC transporter permease [Actinomycetota bacterium]
MTAAVTTERSRWRIAAEQSLALAIRSVRNTARDPGAWVPPMIFPLVLAAIYGAQFSRATELPGFPEVDSFLQFILPASILQGVSFNAGDAGTGMATDIQNGFFDRLMSSPTSRLAVFIGRLAGAIVFSAILATVLVLIFTVFGAPVQGGDPTSGDQDDPSPGGACADGDHAGVLHHRLHRQFRRHLARRGLPD